MNVQRRGWRAVQLVAAEVFPTVPFNSHTHADSCKVSSQGHLSVLEEKLLLKVAISCKHSVAVISVPRLLWVTCECGLVFS